ncbi:LysR substrate-binding domain-containing protein [Mangrovicella endophytica]|uniref:LysR substrate-binding domain-containing protein n=1 Tax=Mangrovicella endophytica TaxID=2066697 RepID=UPI000C9DD747|nr:LysR substrate-binding domain-containing protein [Mangrovicella endophytica]
MARDLPPLAALRAFEAAARHLSFTRAADELGMTQSAVSYQIKLLEERVGAPLFIRQTRAVSLSTPGRMLASAATEALDAIAVAYAAAKGTTAGILAVSAVPTFAATWLAPRIGAFQMRHPELAVRISASRELVDFGRQEFDLAVRLGRGPWPGLVQHRLFDITFAPMVSPTLLRAHPQLTEPVDLLRLPIIDASDPWWPFWWNSAGVATEATSAAADRQRSTLGDQHLEARACIAGHGVAMLTPSFYADEVAAGLLVQPFDILAGDGQSYWLCYPEPRRNLPKIRAFRDWLLPLFADAAPVP